tara:strand:- start:1585 stop:2391 length:807 start_codon:yes stop_codon:yes gene_type:complete
MLALSSKVLYYVLFNTLQYSMVGNKNFNSYFYREDIMALTISESGSGNYEQVPVGTHNATCYMLIDVGTHDETFEGETKKRHSIFVYWELNDSKMADGRPFSIMKQYTLSLNEKSALYKDLCAWRKKRFTDEELAGFDLTSVLGFTCDLEIGLTKGEKSKVTSVYSPDGGAQKNATVNDQIAFDIDEYALGDKEMITAWVDLPTWVQAKIDDSFEIIARDKKNNEGNRDQDVRDSIKAQADFASLEALGDDADEASPKSELSEDDIPF